MSRKRHIKPIKEVTLPKEHFIRVLEKAKRNEEYWKKLATISDDDVVEVESVQEEVDA